MKIITSANRNLFTSQIELIKENLQDWLSVEVQILETAKHITSSTAIAEMIRSICGTYDGFAIICNESQVLLLMNWGRDNDPKKLVNLVQAGLPPNSCETKFSPLTPEGLRRMVLTIAPPDMSNGYYAVRARRKENIFLIADDDTFMRALVKAGLEGEGIHVEVGDGSRVMEAYERYNPDVVLLDIHLPGMSGQMVLNQIKSVDPTAHVIMLSGDSSPENVKWTHQHGARGFLVKPFSRMRLIEYIRTCPTIVRPPIPVAR